MRGHVLDYLEARGLESVSALVLWLPGVIWVAEKIYQWISRNRHYLSRIFGCKDACALLPTRKRSQDG